MKQTRKLPQETKNLPQNGSQLSIDDRLKIIANLIVDRIIEKQQSVITKENV